MRDCHHPSVARDYNGASIVGKPLHPGRIAALDIICILGFRIVVTRENYFDTARMPWATRCAYGSTNLPFVG